MPKTASPGRPTFRVTDYTDRELLAIIDRVAREDPDDAASAADIAEALGINVNGAKKMTPAKAIAPRLGAMRTVGLLDRRTEKFNGEDGPFIANLWFLTDEGKQLLGGRLNKSVDTALGRLDMGQQILVMQRVAQSGYRGGTRTGALAMRRAWQYEQAQRKVTFRPSR